LGIMGFHVSPVLFRPTWLLTATLRRRNQIGYCQMDR
jgi:hypothetical protein